MNPIPPPPDEAAPVRPIEQAKVAGTKARHRLRSRWLLATAAAVLLATAGPWLLESPAEKDFRRAVAHVASVLPAGGRAGPAITTRVEVLRAEGLPKWTASLALDVAVAAPQRLRVAGTLDKQRLEVGRNGQQLWAWAPEKSFGVVGEPGVPRFAGAPGTSLDATPLGPLALPINRALVAVAPLFFRRESAGEEVLRGEKCRLVKITPGRLTGLFFKLPSASMATVWVREVDGWPVQVGCRDGARLEALIALRDLQVGATIPEARWNLPATDGAQIERVALSHLQNFLRAAPKLGDSIIPSLGPADGSRRVVATHGKGRLEIRDGTRVLFLRGTPEEMGEQHGTLLREQVRDLIDRVLYGVGIGSSFSKGRWLFGEIERCQARIEPFIEPRVLREMDALARAAGLESQETRLGNFFPELFHCSGFALMGDATEGHRIYHGRILDYMKGIGLERNAVVIVQQPDEGNAWVNVTYAGFVGSVTAMNERHISIGEMGGRGEGNWDGKPMAQLVREVMEKAGTLDEALEIMRRGPRTCEYYYVIADGKTGQAVGIKATPEIFEVVKPGEAHPQLDTPIADTVLLSAGERYRELVRRVQEGYGRFDADSARALMKRPVCMSSNIHSVLFAPDTLDFWVANADSQNVASHARYTRYNLAELLQPAR